MQYALGTVGMRWLMYTRGERAVAVPYPKLLGTYPEAGL